MQGIPNLRRLHWIHGGGFSWTGRLVFTQILTPNQFTGMVEKLVLQDSPLSELEDLFNNQSYSDYYVVFLRLVLPLIWMTLPPLDSPYLATCSVTNPFTPTSSRMIRLSAGSVKRYDFVLSIVFFYVSSHHSISSPTSASPSCLSTHSPTHSSASRLRLAIHPFIYLFTFQSIIQFTLLSFHLSHWPAGFYLLAPPSPTYPLLWSIVSFSVHLKIFRSF